MRGGADGFGGFGVAFGDIFGDIFGGQARGGRGGGRQVFRGGDLSYAMEITLEEAANGKDSQLRIPSWDACDTCNGSGSMRVSQGFFQMQQPCSRCRGTGRIVKNPCETCLGQGRVRRTRTLSVKVPAGVSTGDRIRLSGEGEAGRNGGPAGDLYVEIAVRAHPIFEREGDDLTCEVPVSFATATLGGSVKVPTLQGEVSIKVPSGTQSGRVFRLRDQGVKPVRGGARGDLYCRVVVETPVDLSAEQRELLTKFDQSLRGDGRAHTPREEGFFEGVRRFFAGR
jgi:molecular chaperone DnaJ